MAVVTLVFGERRLACGCNESTGIPSDRPRLTPRRRARLLRDAQAALAPFGVDWTRYGPAEVVGYDDCVHDDGIKLAIHWPLLADPRARLVLSEVYWDYRTGAILQCGANYGMLVF